MTFDPQLQAYFRVLFMGRFLGTAETRIGAKPASQGRRFMVETVSCARMDGEPEMSSVVDRQERMWATVCHLISYVGYFLPMGNVFGPLAIWLWKREEYPLVDDQGRESLNFQISMTIYVLVAGLLSLVVIGIPILIGLMVWDFVATIIASVRANDGERYRYPLTMRFFN
jgi:uncharacterized Tic20 family protein